MLAHSERQVDYELCKRGKFYTLYDRSADLFRSLKYYKKSKLARGCREIGTHCTVLVRVYKVQNQRDSKREEKIS